LIVFVPFLIGCKQGDEAHHTIVRLTLKYEETKTLSEEEFKSYQQAKVAENLTIENSKKLVEKVSEIKKQYPKRNDAIMAHTKLIILNNLDIASKSMISLGSTMITTSYKNGLLIGYNLNKIPSDVQGLIFLEFLSYALFIFCSYHFIFSLFTTKNFRRDVVLTFCILSVACILLIISAYLEAVKVYEILGIAF
jgi:hypothetical protein